MGTFPIKCVFLRTLTCHYSPNTYFWGRRPSPAISKVPLSFQQWISRPWPLRCNSPTIVQLCLCTSQSGVGVPLHHTPWGFWCCVAGDNRDLIICSAVVRTREHSRSYLGSISQIEPFLKQFSHGKIQWDHRELWGNGITECYGIFWLSPSSLDSFQIDLTLKWQPQNNWISINLAHDSQEKSRPRRSPGVPILWDAKESPWRSFFINDDLRKTFSPTDVILDDISHSQEDL